MNIHPGWLVVGGLVVVALFAAPRGSVQQLFSSSTVSESFPVVAETPQTFSGRGEQNSPPFALKGGNYVVKGKALSKCTYYIRLKNVDTGRQYDGVDVADLDERENFVYDLPAGNYYVAPLVTHATCDWQVTIRPQ